MKIAAVIFDFNGVIIDDEPVHNEAWREVLEPRGFTYTDDEYYGPLLGVPDYEFLRLLILRHGLNIPPGIQTYLLEIKSQVYGRLMRERQMDLPGLADFVRDLCGRVPLGIVSGALRSEIQWHLERLGLRDCFAAIVAAGEYSQPKPDPAPYLTGLTELTQATGRPFDPSQVVVVEDSTNGVLSARGAGCAVLGVTARIARERLPGCFGFVPDFAGLNFQSLCSMVELHLHSPGAAASSATF